MNRTDLDKLRDELCQAYGERYSSLRSKIDYREGFKARDRLDLVAPEVLAIIDAVRTISAIQINIGYCSNTIGLDGTPNTLTTQLGTINLKELLAAYDRATRGTTFNFNGDPLDAPLGTNIMDHQRGK